MYTVNIVHCPRHNLKRIFIFHQNSTEWNSIKRILPDVAIHIISLKQCASQIYYIYYIYIWQIHSYTLCTVRVCLPVYGCLIAFTECVVWLLYNKALVRQRDIVATKMCNFKFTALEFFFVLFHLKGNRNMESLTTI